MASLFSFLGIGSRSSQIQPEESAPQSESSVEDEASPPSPALRGNALDDPEDEKLASSQSPHERDHLTNGAAQPNSQLDDADESETALTVKRRRKPKRRAKDKVAKMPAFDGQADASEVEVPNTQNALQEINGTLSPEAASRAAPGISPQNGRSKRERKRRSRAEITVEMSDGAELPHSQLEPEVSGTTTAKASTASPRARRNRKSGSASKDIQANNGDIEAGTEAAPSQPTKRTRPRNSQQTETEPKMSTQEIQVPSRNGDAPIASQKRKRNRKSQTGISTASVEVEEAVEQVDETPQKRRRVGRKNEKSTSDTAPNGEKSPSRHLENGIANAEDESPILASSLLKTMKAKRKKGPIAGNLNDIPPEDDQLSYNNSNSLDVPNLAGKSTSDHTDRVESEESTSKPSNDEDRSPNDAEGLPVVEPESTAETDNAPLTESEERVANARYVEDEEMEEANGDVLGAGVQNVSDVEMERAENDIVLRNDEQHNTNTPKTSKKERKKKRKAATVDENEEDERTSVPKPRKLRKQGSKANVVEEENAEHEVVPTPKKSKKKRTSNQDSKQPISELPVADMDLSSPEKTRPTRRGHTRGAQEELDVEHTIFGEPNTKESGDFTSDEAELLRREIKRYQFNNDLAVDDLVRLIQWTAPYGKNQDVDETTARQVMCSRLFWRDIYDILPKRKHSKAKGGTTGIQRYVRRNYHNFKGAGKWTPEEDKLLKELCVAHPNQWTKISALIGDRDTTACRDRWRNYLQYGDSRNSSVWSEKEEQKLMETVANFIETLRETREDAERPSIEEYTSRDINWQLVSEVVGTRSRLQCSEKWKALLAREERSSAPVNTPNARKRKSPKKKAPKSDYMVDEDSHEATPLRATSKGKPTKTTPRTSSRRTMLWGDKLDVIEDIMSFDFQSLEEVDWREVDQQALGSNWSIQDRKKVLSELLDEVGEQESFLDALGAICVYMQEHHGDELQQRYDPFVVSEAEYEEDNALMATAAQASNMGKKRKQRSDAGKLRTPNKTKTSRTPSKKYTSNYFVTESDDDS